VLKWCYFALVAAFLAAVVWMLNDTRLRVNAVVDRLDQQLPPILKDSEQAARRINDQLPRILKNTEQAALDINSHLPKLLSSAQQGVSRLADLGKSFRHFTDLFGSLDASRGHRRGESTVNNAKPLFNEQDTLKQ
jgi:hypothetical protein